MKYMKSYILIKQEKLIELWKEKRYKFIIWRKSKIHL